MRKTETDGVCVSGVRLWVTRWVAGGRGRAEMGSLVVDMLVKYLKDGRSFMYMR